MMTATSKVTLHMVASLDGFIAKKDDDISWMMSTDHYEQGVQLSEEEIATFLKSIDCYVMGSKTYEHALELGWPYGEVPVVVLTQRSLNSDRESVTFYHGDPAQLVGELKTSFQNIWMVGGAALTKVFLRQQLVDEIVISIMPTLLGDGMLFFDYIGQEQPLHLLDVKAYQDGMVELSYCIRRE